MRTASKLLLTALASFITLSTKAAQYQLDNNNIGNVVNASEGTEPLDNWFGNVFTTVPLSEVINRVDFGVFTTGPSLASVSLYKVTDPGGNPALGATRLYTQAFTPLTGDGTNAFLQSINLTSPVTFNPGDKFLVGILIRNVIANPPNDKYPFLIDTGSDSTGSYWDRSTPSTFNLDNLSAAVTLTQPLTPGGFVPGPGHVFIRAFGVAVPEPSMAGICALGLATLVFVRKPRKVGISGFTLN